MKVRILLRGSWIYRSDSYISFSSSYVFNTASMLLMAASSASESYTLFLASISLSWIVLHIWILCVCLSSIYWMWVVSSITVSFLVRNSVLVACSRAIPMLWTAFSHIVFILSVEFFSRMLTCSCLVISISPTYLSPL